MRYVSFSLWGDKPIYNIGAIRNSELMSSIYPDWKMILYYNDTVPINTLKDLEKNDVILVNMTSSEIFGAFWRFFAVDIPDCEYAIFRDTDSRISMREKMAVDEWINSGKSLHVMRDHPYHRIPAGNNSLGILSGMWGLKQNVLPLSEMIYKFSKSRIPEYGNDQTFLKMVYNALLNDKITHDEFFDKNPFPIKRDNYRFIGERIDEFENPLTDDYKLLI